MEVSEELNSVETKYNIESRPIQKLVSEELNSVETCSSTLFENRTTKRFQKNLIVWKRM